MTRIVKTKSESKKKRPMKEEQEDIQTSWSYKIRLKVSKLSTTIDQSYSFRNNEENKQRWRHEGALPVIYKTDNHVLPYSP